MKKGKSCVIKGYKQIKCSYGTVDSKNLKSIYLNIQSWVEPKGLEMDWIRPVSILNKNIKSNLGEVINKDLFNDKFIVDLDLRTSGISIKKRSFMNLEITLFVKTEVGFKSTELKNELKEIISSVEKYCFKPSKYFKFYLTKKDKLITADKLENI
jgi:hypothetical protein